MRFGNASPLIAGLVFASFPVLAGQGIVDQFPPANNSFSAINTPAALTTPQTTNHSPLGSTVRELLQQNQTLLNSKPVSIGVDALATAGTVTVDNLGKLNVSNLGKLNSAAPILQKLGTAADLASVVNAYQTNGVNGAFDKSFEVGFVKLAGKAGSAFGPAGYAAASVTAQASFSLGTAIAPYVDNKLGISDTLVKQFPSLFVPAPTGTGGSGKLVNPNNFVAASFTTAPKFTGQGGQIGNPLVTANGSNISGTTASRLPSNTSNTSSAFAANSGTTGPVLKLATGSSPITGLGASQEGNSPLQNVSPSPGGSPSARLTNSQPTSSNIRGVAASHSSSISTSVQTTTPSRITTTPPSTPRLSSGTPQPSTTNIRTSNAVSGAASTAASSAASKAASSAASRTASTAASSAAGRAASGAASNAASRAASSSASNAASRAAANAASNAAANAASRVRIPSDIRLKQDIVPLERTHDGLQLYRYRYLGSDTVYVGVMAQEVAQRLPDAVTRGAHGYLQVDYRQLGVEFLTLDQWNARQAAPTLN
jgi:hypothetical protein